VHFERNRYSVPASYANWPLSLQVYADRLVIVAEGQLVCEHPRIIERNHQGCGRTVYDWRHYLAVLQRKPGALRNGAPFLELPAAFKRLQALLLKQPGGDRRWWRCLPWCCSTMSRPSWSLSSWHSRIVLPARPTSSMSYTAIIDGAPQPETIHSPQALALIVEPQANVVRYDQLRQVRHAS